MSNDTSVQVPAGLLVGALAYIINTAMEDRSARDEARLERDEARNENEMGLYLQQLAEREFLPEPDEDVRLADWERELLAEATPSWQDFEPSVFGTYADSAGDVWRHDESGWQPIETSAGEDVTHLTFATEWVEEVAQCGPFELLEPATHEPGAEPVTLAVAARFLQDLGVDTGRNRLYRYLNEGISWTDGTNTPRPCADGFLVVAEPATEGRNAVVKVTPAGIDALAASFGIDL